MHISLQKEQERVEECLDLSTKKSLEDILNHELITAHANELLVNEAFSKFMDIGQQDDLRRVYELLKRVNLSQMMVDHWVSHVKIRGE